MAFYVGQKVVCVDAGFSPLSNRSADQLVKDRIYTVSGIFASRMGNPSVSLVEVIPHDGGIGFLAARFRPAVERKTDISIFNAMLNPSREEVSA